MAARSRCPRARPIRKRLPSATPRRSGQRRPKASFRAWKPTTVRWRISPRASCGSSPWRSNCRKIISLGRSTSRSARCARSIIPDRTAPPKPGQLRAGAHTDYGSLTILLPAGQFRRSCNLHAGGQWRPVPPVPGAFVINIGDLMALWTNDRWVSTLHRVVATQAVSAAPVLRVLPPAQLASGDRLHPILPGAR